MFQEVVITLTLIAPFQKEKRRMSSFALRLEIFIKIPESRMAALVSRSNWENVAYIARGKGLLSSWQKRVYVQK